MNESLSPSLDQTTQSLMKACEDMNASVREQMDCANRSMAAVTQGWDELARNAGSLMQECVARSLSVSKSLPSAKSLNEVIEMQNDYLRESMDFWMAGTNRLSEIMSRATQQAMEPVTQQANATLSKAMQKIRAA